MAANGEMAAHGDNANPGASFFYRSKMLFKPIQQQLKDFGAATELPNSLAFAIDRVLSVTKDDFEAFLNIAAETTVPTDEEPVHEVEMQQGKEMQQPSTPYGTIENAARITVHADSRLGSFQEGSGHRLHKPLLRRFASRQCRWWHGIKWPPVIHPHSLPACLWAAMVLFIDCSYTCIFVPLGVGLRLSEQLWGAGWCMDFVAGFLFTVDFFSNMRTGFVAKYNGRRLVIMEPKDIVQYYFRHGQGVVHTLSALSWGAQVITAMLAEGLATLHDSRLYGLLTVLRLLRLARGLYMIKRLLLSVVAGSTFKIKYISLTTMTAIKILYGLAVLVNALGCLWYYVASVEGFNGTWVNNYTALARGYGHDDGVLLPEEAAQIPLSRLYLASIYWALTTATTLGYGDIVPGNGKETVIAMCVMLLGVILYGIMLGAITEVIARVSARAREAALYRDKMLDVEKWMKQQKMPRNVKTSIRKFYQEEWLSAQVEAVAVRLFQELPHMLQEEMAVHLLQEAFSSVPLLRSLATAQQLKLCANLAPQHVPKGCYLARRGEPAGCCWLLTEGMVLLTCGDEDIECVTAPALIGEDALAPAQPETLDASATVSSPTETPRTPSLPRPQRTPRGVGIGSPLFRVHDALRRMTPMSGFTRGGPFSPREDAFTMQNGPFRRYGIRTGSGCIVWRLQAQELLSIMYSSSDQS